jgi:thiol-disulfide isomerase/thioredoxin
MLSSGPLTLVLVYADWCGACHKFRDEVWSPLTQLKQATVNRAAIREDMIGKTSLANVQKKFYPTLLLVGADKKPATFTDEEGQVTNAMPRKETLSEDREALTSLVNSPAPATANTITPPKSALTASLPQPAMSIKPATAELAKSPFNKPPTVPVEAEPEPVANQVPLATIPEIEPVGSVGSVGRAKTTGPPDVAADLVASQTASKTAAQGVLTEEESGSVQRGGRLLRAIRQQTASLKAMLRLRKDRATRKGGARAPATRRRRGQRTNRR